MRQLCLIIFSAFLLGCSAVPKISTTSPALPPSKGIKPVGFLDLENLEPKGLQSPTGLAVDPAGNIYIADTNQDRIVKLNRQGLLIKEQGGFGWDAGQFSRPTGLVIDRGLNLYVADSQNKRVQFFDLNLNFISLIEPAETLDFRGLGNVYDVASSYTGELFISDTWNDWVVQTDNFFVFKNRIGGFEAGEGKLQDPLGLAVDSRGHLYVADSGNRRIALFDAFGNYQKSIGPGVLSRPSDIVMVSPEIFVCDQELGQILAFDLAGKLLWRQGSRGAEPGQMREPSGIALFENTLYVVEKGNNRVQIFEIIR